MPQTEFYTANTTIRISALLFSFKICGPQKRAKYILRCPTCFEIPNKTGSWKWRNNLDSVKDGPELLYDLFVPDYKFKVWTP